MRVIILELFLQYPVQPRLLGKSGLSHNSAGSSHAILDAHVIISTCRIRHADNSKLCLESLYLLHISKAFPVQAVLKPLDVQQTKDLETTVAGLRADKMKEKTAADAAKKGERLRQCCSQGLPSGTPHVNPTCAGSAPPSNGLVRGSTGGMCLGKTYPRALRQREANQCRRNMM